MAVLHAASLAASNVLSVDQLIEQVTDVIGNMLYSANLGILLLDEAAGALQPHPSYRGTAPQNLSKPLPLTKGITGKVARTGRPIRTGDVTKDASYFEVNAGMQSELCVPIISRGQVMGVINTESEKENAYTERDERLLTTIANTLATATARLRSFEEAWQRALELEALYQASRSLALSLEPEIIGKNLITTVDELLGYEFASVHLLEDQDRYLVLLAISQKAQDFENHERDKGSLLSKKLQLGDGIIGWVAKNGQSIRTGDVSKEKHYFPVFKNIRSELCIPLIARGKVIGTLNVESPQLDAYTERDESLLTALANSAAIAFENARLYKSELARREQAEILRTATASLSTALDLNILYQIILDSVAKLAPYDRASIETMEQGSLKIMAERGFPVGSPRIGQKHTWDPGIWGEWNDLWKAQHKPMILSNIQSEDRIRLKWQQ